jgi:hypothetical protein
MTYTALRRLIGNISDSLSQACNIMPCYGIDCDYCPFSIDNRALFIKSIQEFIDVAESRRNLPNEGLSTIWTLFMEERTESQIENMRRKV